MGTSVNLSPEKLDKQLPHPHACKKFGDKHFVNHSSKWTLFCSTTSSPLKFHIVDTTVPCLLKIYDPRYILVALEATESRALFRYVYEHCFYTGFQPSTVRGTAIVLCIKEVVFTGSHLAGYQEAYSVLGTVQKCCQLFPYPESGWTLPQCS